MKMEGAGTWGWCKASHIFSEEGAGGDAVWSQHISKALSSFILLCGGWMKAADVGRWLSWHLCKLYVSVTSCSDSYTALLLL